MTSISPALAKSRLARAVQRGDSPERVAELRQDYYAARCRDYLASLISADRLRAEQRRALADVLMGGDRDVAA